MDLDREVLATAERSADAGEVHPHLLVREPEAGGDLVAVELPRGAEQVTAVLGVLAAGASYLPLDPGYPAERLAFIRSDARIAAVVTDSGSVSVPISVPVSSSVPVPVCDPASVAGPPVLSAPELGSTERAFARPPVLPDAGDAAYVIYT